MTFKSNSVNGQTPNPTPVQPTVNHTQNTAAFWFAELAPVSFFAPPAVQNAPANQNETNVIPMNTVPGHCTA